MGIIFAILLLIIMYADGNAVGFKDWKNYSLSSFYFKTAIAMNRKLNELCF